ncbi:MAG TPA: CRISPR system precrRNA processing endoribonuclease RAMP protein Cas6 [Ktedonobacteraceae bacterium]
MGTLVTHHFLFIAEVVTPLELDDHCGAALRGNFFDAVWKRFCNNKEAPTCAACPLHTMCPVSALVAPLREENERGRDISRPYVILPPLGDARRYAPGEQLIFGITLFGSIVQFFPYLIMATSALESKGLGHRLEENQGQRGRFKIKRIESYHPFNGERQVIYQAGKSLVDVPTLTVTPIDVSARAKTLPEEKITLNFLTPTRILYDEKLVHHAAFGPLVQRLLERLGTLEQAYGTEEGQSPAHRWRELVQLTKDVECVEDNTCWEDLRSYSSRTKRTTPISGIQGRAIFVGNLTPFQELLAWGELIHVGKNTVKGNGWFRIE